MKKYTFKVSDESKNSHGFKVITNGIDTTNFKKNPVMYYMHDRSILVIGRWENLRIENNELFADAVFDPKDDFAKKIEQKVKGGFLKAASIGIIPQDKKDGVVTKSQLLEISIVDRGSNNNALRLYNQNEIITLSNNLKPKSMDELKQIAKVLGLKGSATLSDILGNIKNLKDKESKLDKKDKKTAKKLMDKAVGLKLFNEEQKTKFNKFFELDFDTAKESLESLIENHAEKGNSKQVFLNDFLNDLGGNQNNKKDNDDPANKPKSQWELDDYRKFAPKELKDSPQLYEKLIKKEFGSIED
jgi:hypothetical protein